VPPQPPNPSSRRPATKTGEAPGKIRIAIVGAGLSGLVTAHLLGRNNEVTVFEAADYAGGHSNTVRVDTAGETHQVDTGFIVFNDRNYPTSSGSWIASACPGSRRR
jgi:predicted NAD/FAD-binding protein